MFVIRAAEASDAKDLEEMARDLSASFVPETSAFRRSLHEILSSPSARLLVAEGEAGLAGYVLAFEHPTFYANGPVAWAEEIYVRPEARRKGLGSRLMKGAEDWAKERDCRLIALATRRADSFYRAIGYEEAAVYFRKVFHEPG
jgi:GNAT superfamily N-acetyltransferase